MTATEAAAKTREHEAEGITLLGNQRVLAAASVGVMELLSCPCRHPF